MLVGVDFSEGAAAAVQEARRLAGQIGCSISVAHVTENGDDLFTSGPAVEWLATMRIEPGAVKVVRGVAWIELARLAAETGAGLLVVGSHGRSGFNPMGPGRTAARLAVRSPIPVVVVPAGRRLVVGDVDAGDRSEHEPEGVRRLQGQYMTRRETSW